MATRSGFFNLYRHGFARVALATPLVRIGDPMANAAATLALMQAAAKEKVIAAVFPELGLSAYSCEDLFHQQALLRASEEALAWLLARSKKLPIAAFVGLPVAVDGLLYNCAAFICRGQLLGVVPKTYLPNYREFYELRQFTPGTGIQKQMTFPGQSTAFGSLLFRSKEQPGLVLFAEICEDLWVPSPPSSYAALAGATVIANLSASNVVVGKDQYRRELAGNQSARCIAAYLYSAAGGGGSTADLSSGGPPVCVVHRSRPAQSSSFDAQAPLTFADVDLERLQAAP